MSDDNNQPDGDEAPGSRGTNVDVGYAGEPSGSLDTRDLAGEEAGPSPEDLDAREENFTAPRKAMGPTGREDEVPETVPEES